VPETHKIRLTIRPDDEIEVGEREYVHLKRQGLVLNTKATTDEGARKAALKQTEAPAPAEKKEI